MFADCRSPIWRGDDFSTCFERDYLVVVIPLAACSLSLFHLVSRTIYRAVKLRYKTSYVLLNGLDVDGGIEVHEEEGSALKRVRTQDSTAEVDRPRGALLILIIETLALLSEISISLAVLLLNQWGRYGRTAALARVLVWTYIAILACFRLLALDVKIRPLPRLWNHTALLYAVQWMTTVVVFRTAIIHPRSRSAQALMVADFALVSLLVIIALTARRGNRAVTLVHDGKLQPSREPLASVLSLLTFSWADPLIIRGYRTTLELPDVWDLLPKYKAAKLLADFEQVKKSSRLAWRLVRFFKKDLVFQFLWSTISAFLTFAPTLLLKLILEYVERPQDTPVSVAWLYVILLPICGMISGIADGQALWRGREICIKLRAVLVGEIYAKTLRRKAASSGDTDMKDEGEPAGKSKSFSLLNRFFSVFRTKRAYKGNDASKAKSEDTQVNSGTIINLMSVDSFKVAEIGAYMHFLVPSVPIQLALAIGLLYGILGWSSIAGFVIMILLIPLNLYISKAFSSAHKNIMASTDARIHTTNEVMNNVRIVKFFAWEQKYMQAVEDKREVEIRALRYRFRLFTGASCLWYGIPLLITGVSFFIYTVIEKKPLAPSVAFTALSLFSLLRYPLDRLTDMLARCLESKVSVDRIERFLNEEETSKYSQLSSLPSSEAGETFIGFKNATFSWGPKEEPSGQDNPAFRMINMDISFHIGALNIVAGPTGAGKTSLLMALLGEMTLLHGSVHLPGGYIRDELPLQENGLTESVAYCAQQAWLVNDTIKQNILFATPYDELRYNNVIDACALRRDFEALEAGDSTLVGEKGIVVSGGQKQRISLARALYSNARHILLDDCLSAVDSHTAQHIFEKCIMGPLMLDRTCILVTHNTALCVPAARHVVVLANGKIAGQGTPQEVISKKLLGEDLLKSGPGSKNATRPPSRNEDDYKTSSEHDNDNADGNTDEVIKKPMALEDVQDANIRTESKAEGAVALKVIRLYFDSMGPWYYWIGVLLGFALTTVSSIVTNVWIREWANSYETRSTEVMYAHNISTVQVPFHRTGSTLVAPYFWIVLGSPSPGPSVLSASSEPDVGYYLGIYALLGLLYVLLCLFQFSFLFKGSLNASRSLHKGLLESVLRAKFQFFDTTPLGQIMNRFSKDLQSIDQDVASIAAGVLQSVLSCAAIVILISIITPGFLIAAVFLAALYVIIGKVYIGSSRDLKRLESANRSPLYQQFGETLSGITTIRAYGDERRFIRDNSQRINTHNRPFIYLWAANRWLALRIDFAGALVAFFAALFVVIKAGKIDAGTAGVSLTYAITFNDCVLWLVRLYADNEQNMNHVERIKQYLEVEQEAPASIPETKPPRNWPNRGAVQFINYSTRYRPGLEPVLQDLNICIEGEEKVGILGRTGAGKSSLALALFRGLEADSGRILIDSVDIGQIGLQDLRENITIVPQDPTLFTGNIRSNLDPFGVFTDEEIFTALRRVHLIGSDLANQSGSATPAPATVASPSSTTPLMGIPSQTIDGIEDSVGVSSGLRAPIAVIPPAGVDPLPPSADPDPQESNGSNLGLSKVPTNTHTNANPFTSLSFPIAESGTNLSQGQRQLLCLARALLKSPRVLLMDEATASIDYATDAKIQDTLREIKGSTLITIAHRLKTVIDYDKLVVLDKGKVVETGTPWELMNREQGGAFRGMCEMSGEWEALVEAARHADGKRRLVDLD